MTDGYGNSSEHLAATCVQCLFTSMNSDKHQAVVFADYQKICDLQRFTFLLYKPYIPCKSLIASKFL